MTETTQMGNVQTELAQKFAQVADNLKAQAEEIQGKMANGEKLSETAKQTADEALIKYNELSAKMQELEQKSARRGGGGGDKRTLGQRLADSEQLKQLQADPRGVKHAKIEVKAATIGSATSDTAGAAGSLVRPDVQAGIIAPPNRRLTVRDLLMSGQTASNAITYMKETGFTNAAAAQASEGDKKAQSDIKFGEVTTNVVTLAHYIKASRQILHDAPMLASYINGRLMYGLKLIEEQQLLNGDGESGNLKGIIPQATAFADKAKLEAYTLIDQLRLAQLQTLLAEYPATGYVLNPIDWATLELAKDNEGRYIIGQPQSVASPTLWGLPVVATQAIEQGKFLTGAFNLAAQIFDSETASIEVGFENDDFTRNLITVLCEERLALAVYRPEAFIYGTLKAKWITL